MVKQQIWDGIRPTIMGSSTSLMSMKRNKSDISLKASGSLENLEAPSSGQAIERSFNSKATDEQPERRTTISLRCAVFSAITFAVVVSWLGLFVPLELNTRARYISIIAFLPNLVQPQEVLIRELVDEKAAFSYSSLMASIATTVKQFIQMPAEEAVNIVGLTMQAQHHVNESWTGRSSEERRFLGYQSWLEMKHQMTVTDNVLIDFAQPTKLTIDQHVSQLFTTFASGEVVGVSAECPAGLEIDPNWFIFDSPGGNDTLMSKWKMDPRTGEKEMPLLTAFEHNISEAPYYNVQADFAQSAPRGTVAQSMWSKLYSIPFGHNRTPELGMAWTTPIAKCGRYDCFQGVIASIISVRYVSAMMSKALDIVQGRLRGTNDDNSNIFIVNQASRFPEQQGILIGRANAKLEVMTNLTPADASSQLVVRSASRALVSRFGSWTSPELLNYSNFTYDVSAALEDPPRFAECSKSSEWGRIKVDNDCLQVGTASVKLDNVTTWLVVTVLPAGVFGETARAVAADLSLTMRKQEDVWSKSVRYEEALSISLFLGMMGASFCITLGLSYLVARPIRHLSSLSTLMRRLGDLDFAPESRDMEQLRTGSRSVIREVNQLQNTFCRLSRGVETFAHFVPEGVVRKIVGGDHHMARPHVSLRTVTIMFTDIRDFTAISESLSQTDLLFVLTRYLTAMTSVADAHCGVLTEILGDGLLIFWNTPDDVPDHAVKACEAALAMQEALVSLNNELAAKELPQLSIRIGLHTGTVLSGNIGCAKKMKFGCLGDPVNLASRLEGLCKDFGVGVIISSATYLGLHPAEDALEDADTTTPSRHAGFLCRKLALAKVKGRSEPTLIYELMGRDPLVGEVQTDVGVCRSASLGSRSRTWGVGLSPDSVEEDVEANASAVTSRSRDMHVHAQAYERALAAFHAAAFGEAVLLADQVLVLWPADLAAQRLRREAARYVATPDGEPAEILLQAEEVAAWTGAVRITEK